MKKTFLSLMVCLVMAGNASADLFSGGAGFAFVDNSVQSGTLNAVSGLTVVSFDNVIVNVTTTHTWIGDVTLTLRSPLGTQVQLMRRPGVSGAGNSGDMLAGLHTFAAVGTALPATNVSAPMPAGTTWAINSNPGATYTVGPNSPAPNPNTFAAFNGESINGTWTLFGADAATGDVGVIGSWSMNITTIPEPGSFLVLSAFGLASLVRRRRS